MAGAFGLPQLASLFDPNVAVDQAALERRMAIAQALRQQAMQPVDTQGRQIGGMGYKISPWEGIAKVVQGVQANRADTENDQARLELNQRMVAALQSQLGGSTPSAPAGPQMSTPGNPQTAVPPPQGQPQGGGFAGGIPGLMRGALINDIGGPAMGAAYAKQFEPTELTRTISAAGMDPNSPEGQAAARAGVLKATNVPLQSFRPGGYAYDPSTKRMENLPQTAPGFASVQDSTSPTGFKTVQQPGGVESLAASAGATEGAKEAAKAPFEIHMVKLADGREIPVSTQQLVAGLRGGSSPNAAAPASSGVASLTVTQPSTNAAPTDPWVTVPKRATPTGMGQTTFDQAMQGEQAKDAGELAKKFGGEASIANQRMALNNQALSLVDQADTGPGATQIADIKNLLTSRFGVSEDAFQNTPTSTQVLNKDLLNAATQKAKQIYGARMTQSEVMLQIHEGAPNVDFTKGAIKFLLNTDNKGAQYSIQQANDLGKYVQMGGDPQQFEGWYAKSFPLTQAIGSVHPPGKVNPQAAAQQLRAGAQPQTPVMPAGLQLPPGFKYVGPAQ